MMQAKHSLAAFLSFALAGGALAPTSVQAQPLDEIKPDDPEMVPPASKDPTERAREFYTRGRKNYDLARFRRAIALFTKAYEELPDGAFLFNIAQSYRQLDDCKQALFYYKRFLSVQKDISAVQRKEVDGHIESLTKCVKDQDAIRNRPPDGTSPPDIGGGGGNDGGGTTGGGGDGGGTTGGGGGTDDGGGRVGDLGGGGDGGGGGGGGGGDDIDDGGDDGAGTPSGRPKTIAVFARGGGARFAAGSLTPTFVAAAGLSAGYPLTINDKLALDLGGAFGFMPVAWNGAMSSSGTSSLITVGAHAGVTYTVAPKIGVRGEFDVGALLITGLEAGNPFTLNAQAATGALSMLSIRAGLAAEYAFNPNLSLVVTPIAFSFSPASSDSFTSEVDSFTRLEFLAGLGYRM
ncbi:MAG: hypothetical protein IPL61_31765 [Myxococcales bacterium]|nr:hypothetical protein [Myxococcales bacterium]